MPDKCSIEILKDNPMGLNGFEFIEFCAPKPSLLHQHFLRFGFRPAGKHRSKPVTLYQQGKINFIVNAQENSHASAFAKAHGPSACAMGFRVCDADRAFKRALELGARPYEGLELGKGELEIPAIYGIGDSLIYFVDYYDAHSIYDIDFILDKEAVPTVPHVGLTHIDHLTHNVRQGEMDKWTDFYQRIFGFKEIRFFDIEGEKTGLVSRALASPCGKIKIPLNESKDAKSQIEEFIREFNGEGIQHIALATDDIYKTVETMQAHSVDFLDVPDTYYEAIDKRLPEHGEDLARLRQDKILIDGECAADHDPRLLLQIFTENMLGPVFFEIIQRKGDEGFGEGNFQALFEAIERDQIKRGIL